MCGGGHGGAHRRRVWDAFYSTRTLRDFRRLALPAANRDTQQVRDPHQRFALLPHLRFRDRAVSGVNNSKLNSGVFRQNQQKI